jgi:hypothetical protein
VTFGATGGEVAVERPEAVVEQPAVIVETASPVTTTTTTTTTIVLPAAPVVRDHRSTITIERDRTPPTTTVRDHRSSPAPKTPAQGVRDFRASKVRDHR